MAGFLVAAGLAGLTAAGYQSMAPTGQWYGRTFTRLPRSSRMLALTYDDGPNDPHTLKLLDVLARQNVTATFFLIGRYVVERQDIVRAITAAGHTVGNHTFTHPNLILQTTAETRSQITRCTEAITDAIGAAPRFFRPPFGGRRPATLQAARSLGLLPIMWSVTGYDWNADPAELIQRKVTRQVRGGDVILLHDGSHKRLGGDRSQTVIATDALINRYRSEGFQFASIPEMLASAPQTTTPPDGKRTENGLP
ncbi:MAG: polysaccharide deacetylase family protein [Acidobacteriales bacterium]|nr:polysaccharide deacetylase family protein [Terriglobales bacterium]